ncbi:hypothetical protein ACA910_006783 [Epithemia clementina (nom. ined.)]
MAPNRFMTELDFTKTQIAVYIGVMLLSIDALNPIKILCSAVPWLHPWHWASTSLALLVYVVLSEFKQVLYFLVKAFFHSILSIFFRHVEVVGVENVPRFGPVLFTINHANQFIDAVSVLSTCQRKISYLMAEASYKRRIVGDLAWALDVVPVKRAQDEAEQGTGTIAMTEVVRSKDDDSTAVKNQQVVEDAVAIEVLKKETDEKKGDDGDDHDDNNGKQGSSTLATAAAKATEPIKVQGFDTRFTTELGPGDKIRPSGTSFAFKVIQVDSDTELVVDGSGRPSNYDFPVSSNPQPFDALKKVDTAQVFEKVLERLASGGAVGIFPEGGSHDRTELLPLKVGIALIAYSALDKHNLNIPIVPVGLNYFRAHRWRGKAVIEYGRPTMIDASTLPQFQQGGEARRAICNALLEDIERSMKSVLVSAPDYETLEMIHTARRLWQYKKGTLETAEKQDLTRRFAQGYQLLLQHPNPPDDWQALYKRITDYRQTLKELGLRDYQVPALTEEHMERDVLSVKDTWQHPTQVLQVLHYTYQTLHLLFLISVAAIPFLLINLPVGILAGWYAEQRRKRALAKSKVKINAYDVMLTEKVLFCIVAVPTLWIIYGIALRTLTDWNGSTIALCLGCLPLFAYMGIVAAEAGMVDLKDLQPMYMRLGRKTRRRLAALPKVRKELQDDLRAFIKEVGPKYLGPLYYKDKIDWTEVWGTTSATQQQPDPSLFSSPAATQQTEDASAAAAAAAAESTPPTTKKDQ